MIENSKVYALKKILGGDYNLYTKDRVLTPNGWVGGLGIEPEKLYDALLAGDVRPLLDPSQRSGSIPNQIQGKFNDYIAKNTQGIDLSRINDAFTVIGATPQEAAVHAATSVVPAIQDEFKRILGRDPTQGEVASLVNKMDLKGFIGGNLAPEGTNIADVRNQILNNPGFLQNELKKQGGIENFIKQSKPLYDQITLANNNLKNIGQSLSGDEIANILNSTPEQAGQLANSYTKSYREGAVNQTLAGLPARQEQAISDLDRALQGSQGQFFSNELQPMLERSLAARGLLHSGSLAEAFASAGKSLNTAREGIIAPLRTNTALGTQQMGFENTLRGALESGKSLSEATSLFDQLFAQGQQNQFSAGQNALNRQFNYEQGLNAQALSLALQSGQVRQPGPLDYFLQYGLPTVSNVLGGPLGGALAKGIGNLFSRKSDGGGGSGYSQGDASLNA